jgi:hypothetical protein
MSTKPKHPRPPIEPLTPDEMVFESPLYICRPGGPVEAAR